MWGESVSLNELNLKKSYDSDIDDIVKDFYIPTLCQSTKYQRLAGFFSSSALAVAARGMSDFIKNGGTMELICSANFQKKDIEAIKMAYNKPEELIEKSILSDFEKLEDGIIKDHVAALGWMVANKKLEIKIAVLVDAKGIPTDENRGMFHQKVGILTDEKNNMLSFSGSINESEAGWKYNIEEIKVFKGWEESGKEYFLEDLKNFKKYWGGNGDKLNIYEIPEAVEKELIKIAPISSRDIKIDLPKGTSNQGIQLYDHQNTAISKWASNKMVGIFEMATGTGKTFTALGCLNEFFSKFENKSICIVACPYSHLIDQWIEDVRDFGFDEDIVIANSTNPSWKRELNDHILDINTEVDEKLIIFTTHDTLSSDKFITSITESNANIFLIVDEVHGIGSKERRKGLLEIYSYRLGLSATPSRWFDEEGTEILRDYFKKVVFSFTLEEALTTINDDTGEYYLTPYEYRPIFVELTPSELEEYRLQSQKISRAYHTTSDKTKRHEIFTLLLNKRKRIINNAINKYKALNKVLAENQGIKDLLVYCSPQQMDTVQDILIKQKITPQHTFTMNEGTRKEARYGGTSFRDYLLKQFANGEYRALVAMKCLDEGVDVPSAKTAIIMASTSNPREYIQRRGRVLRRSPSKKKAVIYDLIVLPKTKTDNLDELEKKILKMEVDRYKEFARSAKNSAECMDKLQREVYGVNL